MKKRYSQIFLTGASILGISGLSYGVSREIAEPGQDKQCEPLSPEEQASLQYTHDIDILGASVAWKKLGTVVDDASCLDATTVYGVVQVRSIEDIQNALTFAKAEGIQVSIAGVRHSMGGHAFKRGAIMLDMTEFNAVSVQRDTQTITVESGATWHDIQEKIHPEFAVMAMQSTDIFTVGGSISVNAHGMDHQSGAVENSIVSMMVLTPEGVIETITRESHPEYYNLIVGGYGLFGIILEVTLRIVPNDVYSSRRTIIDVTAFPSFFEHEIETNKDIGLMYVHLSTAPGSEFLKEAIVYEYEKVKDVVPLEQIPPLGEISSVKLRRLVMNLSKHGSWWQQLRWWSEKYLEPKMESCSITRNTAQSSGEACLVSRNEPMHDSVPYLKNSLKKETDILHEYFIPRENIIPFIDRLRMVMREHEVNLLNASIRVVGKERGFLTYAPEEAFSVVLYINQTTDEEGHKKMRTVTSTLIDAAEEQGGTFFLPYQLHYTKEQLKAAYPNIDEFFALKKQYDPYDILSNTWYTRYSI
ncbi:MAG: putative oxidoreductase in fasciation locus [Candidatus Parcubacteria bacterium]|jgi:FAD/FMN-containing dehydrogenase